MRINFHTCDVCSALVENMYDHWEFHVREGHDVSLVARRLEESEHQSCTMCSYMDDEIPAL